MKKPRFKFKNKRKKKPLSNGSNGEASAIRDAFGRFKKGNPGGPGSPYSKRVAAFKRAAINAVTPLEVIKVVRRLLKDALDGDHYAARVLLDRVLGRVPVDLSILAVEQEPYAPDLRFL